MPTSSRGLETLRFLLEHATTVPDDLIAHLAQLDDTTVRRLLLARPELPDAEAEHLFLLATRWRDRGQAAAAMTMRTYRRTDDARAAAREAETRVALASAQALLEGVDSAGAHDTVKELVEATTAGHPLRFALVNVQNLRMLQALASECASAKDVAVTYAAVRALDDRLAGGTLTPSEAGTTCNHIGPALNVILREEPRLGASLLTEISSRLALRRWLTLVGQEHLPTLSATTAAYLLGVVVIEGIEDLVPDGYVSDALSVDTCQMLASAADQATCERTLQAIERFGRRNTNRDDPVWRGVFALEAALAARLRTLASGCPVALNSEPTHVDDADKAALADWMLDQVPTVPHRWGAYAAVVDTLSETVLTAETITAATSGVLGART